ncbi:hypothetical protein [Microbacterium halotolerans]|uniref:hypothetical protein n=1 Tax=Microbacterium halotolerans TaxID=246613 RepID=UPI000E6AC20C|nr:hypothetical protein [Microbacterium halotolerans]
MTFPDVEALLLDFLEARASTVQFVTQVPSDRPGEFVCLWRNGGAAMNRVVDRPMVTVDTWAPSKARASELAGQVRTLLLGRLGELPQVRGVLEVSGLHWNPDPESETPRYRFSIQLTVRAARR